MEQIEHVAKRGCGALCSNGGAYRSNVILSENGGGTAEYGGEKEGDAAHEGEPRVGVGLEE
jgi:hypothetical protein